ncbi:MAG TPA: adenosylmethionine decarboxylase [Methylomirabilota bacterium]|nr:adenosylmethionine decarboxylase [Methylomirabilota bacterium]
MQVKSHSATADLPREASQDARRRARGALAERREALGAGGGALGAARQRRRRSAHGARRMPRSVASPRRGCRRARRHHAARRRASRARADASRPRRKCRTTRFFLAMTDNGPYSQLVFARGGKIFSSQRRTRDAGRRRGAVDGRIGQRRVIGLNALGRHLLLELFDCDPDAITNLEAVKTALVEAAKRAQATIVDVVFHEFNPFGISGVVVIAESHLSIHTWPEYRYAAVDIFSCGDVLNPEVAANYLVEQFAAERTSVVDVQRGMFLNSAVPIVNKASVAVS